MEITLNSTQTRKKTQKVQKDKKESVKNADLYKPVLNKIMTTPE